ncbi:hypothetical protein [Paenarthrobacter aurescens]|jgi:hypothetical protein|uniref:Uncharacterized protein n=1 Tax=Paenarthrobacter aurescens (strain TC1) TaxID=290340 RepID=A1R3Z6_PAEAT|nr:hypothetical protein [Paenarthrobacter aurescens]ABM10146.1 hypothetical protein AAur_1172 [Paenarthrobacter aurescens TC1]
MNREQRDSETTFGPLQLKNLWEPHILRDFELRVIMQMADCEGAVCRLLAGEPLGPSDRAPLEVANHVAKTKGFRPLFVASGQELRISDGGETVLLGFFESDVWSGRNPRQTRRA